MGEAVISAALSLFPARSDHTFAFAGGTWSLHTPGLSTCLARDCPVWVSPEFATIPSTTE